MIYTIEFTRNAEKSFRKIPAKFASKIIDALNSLSIDPYSHASVKKLEGVDGYRLRVGDYREILVICVIKVGTRGDVYKRG